MATPNLDLQNYFSTTLSQAVLTADTQIFLSALPTPTEGYLVIDPNTPATREIIYYNAKGANYVTCPASGGRGVGGTTAQGHSLGVTVQMNFVAEMWREIQNGNANAGLINFAKSSTNNFVVSGLTIATSGNLTSSVAGGVCYVNGKRFVVTTTSKAFTASKDTHVDIKDNGDGTYSIVYVEVANNAQTGMTLTTNSDGSPALRIAYVVTSGSAVTTVKQVPILVPSATSFSGFDAIGNRIFPQKGDTAVGRYIRPSAVTTGQPGATPATYNGCNNIPFQAQANTDYILEFYEPVVSGITATGAWTIECYLSASAGAFTARIDEITMTMIGAANNGLYFQLPFNSGSYSGLTYLEFKLRSVSTTGTATMNGDTSTRMGRFSIYKR